MKFACPFCGNKGDIPDGSKPKPLKCRRCGTRFHPKPRASASSGVITSPVNLGDEHAIDVNAVVSQLRVDLGVTTIDTVASVYRPNRKRRSIRAIFALAGLTVLVCLIAGWLLTGLTSLPIVREVFLSKEQKAIERWIHIIPTFNPDTDKILRWYPAQEINAADIKHLGTDCVIRVKFRLSSMFRGPENADYFFYMTNGKIKEIIPTVISTFDQNGNMAKLYFPDDFDF